MASAAPSHVCSRTAPLSYPNKKSSKIKMATVTSVWPFIRAGDQIAVLLRRMQGGPRTQDSVSLPPSTVYVGMREGVLASHNSERLWFRPGSGLLTDGIFEYLWQAAGSYYSLPSPKFAAASFVVQLHPI